ncbi:hypothetical protein JB92DRAFT_3014323 [Gautieria morchelliformis]|nr:hypothetical protein JB92DRAFT_3014323 [Gautieria morchelliformis]
MHATVSHTLGPSASFTASSVTRLTNSDASTSYAVMRTAPGIVTADRDKTVWKWRDRHARRPEEQPEPKQSAVFPHHVEEIWAPSGLPSNVIAVSPSGDVILSDEDLKVMSSIKVPYSQSTLLKSFVFGPKECTFMLPRFGQPLEMVVMCFIMAASRLKLRILLAQSTGELEEVNECDLGVYEDVICISCDPSGYTTILARRGDWWLFRLGHDSAGAVTATPLDKALCLTGLSLDLSSNGGPRIRCNPSVISVGSSFVLLAGISSDDPAELVLLLWDIQYSVVLATQRFPLPSTVGCSPKSPLILELVPVSRSQALLVLSPTIITTSTRTASAMASRSTVLVAPLTIPPASTISLSMGKACDTRRWLRNLHTSTQTMVSDEDGGRHRVMQSVRQALEQGRPDAAEAAFFSWVEQETSRLHRLRKVDTTSDGERRENRSDRGPVSKAHPKSQHRKDKWKRTSSPSLSHQFVSNLLNGILRPSQPSDSPSPSKIVQYLINRRAVSHAMVQGGLLPALRRHQDWESIASALDNVHDLSEGDIVCLLLEVVRSHRLRQNTDPGGMQVGAPSDVPALPNFLAMLVVYTSSSPTMLRSLLKMHLTDARDIICILEVLEGWLAWWYNTNPGLAFDLGDYPTAGAQASMNKKSDSTERSKVPSFRSVITFLQSVLDVHFLTLLHYTPSHSVIERISRQLREQLLSVDDLDRLRGPLEAFVRVQSQSFPQRPVLEAGENLRQKRREAFEAAELTVGPYQIEELVI